MKALDELEKKLLKIADNTPMRIKIKTGIFSSFWIGVKKTDSVWIKYKEGDIPGTYNRDGYFMDIYKAYIIKDYKLLFNELSNQNVKKLKLICNNLDKIINKWTQEKDRLNDLDRRASIIEAEVKLKHTLRRCKNKLKSDEINEQCLKKLEKL